MPQRIRWLMILVPAMAVGAVHLLSDKLLNEAIPFPWDVLIVVVTVLIFGFVFVTRAMHRIDSLTSRLSAREADLERRTATVRALHRVSLAVTATAELDRILESIVDQARILLRADAAVMLLDDAAGGSTIGASSGDTALVRRMFSATTLDGVPPDESIASSRLASPLHRAGETMGSLVVGSRAMRSYGLDEVEFLSSLANQAAMAVENARLQDRLRELAVVTERERIAREMHDGLAQVLGYVNTKSQAAEQLLADGRVGEARLQIGQLAAAARSIYVDVREAILGLRSAIDPGLGLIQAAQDYVTRFAEASKLAVRVHVSDEARSATLSLSVEDQVLRILQESLSNVRKHADASRALVEIDLDDDAFVLRVTDDGCGMAAHAEDPTGWPHYGLAAMRERAESIDGTIEWTPGLAGGTVVTVVVPLVGRPVNPARASGSRA